MIRNRVIIHISDEFRQFLLQMLSFIIITCSLSTLIGCEQREPAEAEWPHAAVGVLDADISTDGTLALVSSVNFGAGLWDLTSNQLKFQWTHNNDPQQGIVAVDISPDGRRAITASEDTFVIWNTDSGQAYGYWQTPSPITSVALSNLGRYALLGLQSGVVIFIDMNTGRRIEFLGHGSQSVASVDLSANGQWALTGGNDYRAVLWSTKTGMPKQLFEHNTRVVAVTLGPAGKQVFSAGTLGNAFIWDIATGEKISRLDLKQREYVITAARFSNDGSRIVTGAPNRDISLWQVESGKRLQQWRARTRDQGKPSGAIIYAVGLTDSDRFVLTESSAGFGEKWRIK